MMNWAATIPLIAVFLVWLELRVAALEKRLEREADEPP